MKKLEQGYKLLKDAPEDRDGNIIENPNHIQRMLGMLNCNKVATVYFWRSIIGHIRTIHNDPTDSRNILENSMQKQEDNLPITSTLVMKSI